MQYSKELDRENINICKDSMTKLTDEFVDYLNEILKETTVLFIDPKKEICYDNKNV